MANKHEVSHKKDKWWKLWYCVKLVKIVIYLILFLVVLMTFMVHASSDLVFGIFSILLLIMIVWECDTIERDYDG